MQTTPPGALHVVSGLSWKSGNGASARSREEGEERSAWALRGHFAVGLRANVISSVFAAEQARDANPPKTTALIRLHPTPIAES